MRERKAAGKGEDAAPARGNGRRPYGERIPSDFASTAALRVEFKRIYKENKQLKRTLAGLLENPAIDAAIIKPLLLQMLNTE